MTRSSRAGRFTRPMLVAVLLFAAGGCSRGASSPEGAHERLREAVTKRDGLALFDALDTETRSAWMTVQRAHREAYDIVLSNFPENLREREIRRFEDAALVESTGKLFASRAAEKVIADLAPHLASAQVTWDIRDDVATATTATGRTLVFDKQRGWGYAGLKAEAKTLEKRAWADLEVVRTSATDYERAATRGQP